MCGVTDSIRTTDLIRIQIKVLVSSIPDGCYRVSWIAFARLAFSSTYSAMLLVRIKIKNKIRQSLLEFGTARIYDVGRLQLCNLAAKLELPYNVEEMDFLDFIL